MISLKKYLDLDRSGLTTVEPETNELSAATMDSFRAVLLAIGKCAVQVAPGLGVDLETSLRGFERRLSVNYSPDSVKKTEKQVEVQLQEWGARTSEHFRARADEVKELLMALAKTAESVGSRDQGYSNRFKDLTGRIAKIADLDDLTQIRSSLVARVTELKGSVDQMTRENQELVSTLRTEISIYETRLKSAEMLALKDELTGLANRRSVEERIQWNIAKSHEFCVVLLDLNRFKEVNDEHGHLAGDDLLKQFGMELQLNTRTGDLVGRWGGDEFLVVLSCGVQAAKAHIQRIRDWVFGKYTIRGGGSESLVIQVDAAIGAADWHTGETMEQLIAQADSAMYLDKKLARQKTA
jgi:diguanylate cyclase (GGDEF)-like protein